MLRPRVEIPSRFELVRLIGEGGMGAVYEARDVERDLRVAIKTVLHRDADALARFKNEFRALQDLHHPNLVTLGELVGESGGDVFFTMELIEGVDLLTWVRGESRREARSGSNGKTAAELKIDSIDTDRDQASFATPPTLSGEQPIAGRFDEKRLRDSFRQIALGLMALHDAGKIHRDVKPSNVRVTPDGRVVLLDFGLVFDVDSRHAQTETNVVGTPAYMAPEQASTDVPVGAQADWYAVGVMLYQCLTGRLPFEGAAMAVLLAKHYQDPPAPSSIAADVPRDLEELCLALLQFDPQARPIGREVLRKINARSSKPPVAPARPSMPVSAPFVGRATEMSALRAALDDVATKKRTVTVALHGESGVGKSSLARRFLEAARDTRGAMVLTGRCYEREAVPYKAFDEVMDALSRKLARLPKEEALALLPSRIEALAQLFPALGRVPVVAQATGAVDRDPHERRRAAFRALRELLRKMSARTTLVIAIDDLQWTDADSLSLLVELLRPPDAPPILLLVTLRGANAADVARHHDSADGRARPPALVAQIPGDVRAIHVGRLAKEDARELATRLLSREEGISAVQAEAIASEAGGHPLFIDELVRHAAAHVNDPAESALRLDDALWTRVERLDLAARRVLEVACVLGAPAAQEVVAHAAGLDMREFQRAVSLLRTTNFVRTRGARVTDAIEPFHDRVREALVARIDPDARRECHARIATALEVAKGSDPEVLATHWAGAGERAKATSYAIVAAEQAATALAFERAARLFHRALDLVGDADPRRRVLREQLGDALANAGQGAAAAAEYERAAKGASADDARDLRRRAAEQLLRAGEVERGLAATRGVLESVGLSLPRTRFGAVLALLWYRFVLAIRGLGFAPRPAKEVPPADLLRVDVCWSVSGTLGYADPIGGALFQARHLLLALRAGERGRVVRALAIEGGFLGAAGGRALARAERIIGKAREAAVGLDDPYSEALLLASEGLARCFALRFVEAIDLLRRSVELFRARCPGSSWEVTTVAFFLFMAEWYSCRYASFGEQHDAALKDADERGDRYGAVMLRVGALNRRWLAEGDPARARRELEAARRMWPERPFHVMHFHALVAATYIDMYEGEAQRAHERLEATRAAVRGSLLLMMEGARLEYLAMRQTIALALLAADPKRADRAALLRDVRRGVRLSQKLGAPVCRAGVHGARACLAAIDGSPRDALPHLDALAAEEAEEAWLASRTARWLAAAIRGSAADVEAAVAELRARRVLCDRRLVAAQFPGLAHCV